MHLGYDTARLCCSTVTCTAHCHRTVTAISSIMAKQPKGPKWAAAKGRVPVKKTAAKTKRASSTAATAAAPKSAKHQQGKSGIKASKAAAGTKLAATVRIVATALGAAMEPAGFKFKGKPVELGVRVKKSKALELAGRQGKAQHTWELPVEFVYDPKRTTDAKRPFPGRCDFARAAHDHHVQY